MRTLQIRGIRTTTDINTAGESTNVPSHSRLVGTFFDSPSAIIGPMMAEGVTLRQEGRPWSDTAAPWDNLRMAWGVFGRPWYGRPPSTMSVSRMGSQGVFWEGFWVLGGVLEGVRDHRDFLS